MTNEKRKQGKVAAEAAGANKDKGVTRKRLVAVYGTLMAGERNQRWVEEAGAKRLGEILVRGWLYDTGYGFPAIVPGDHGEGHTIRAELIETDDAGIAHMDVLEGYPRLYTRQEVEAEVCWGYPESFVKAEIYVMNELPVGAELIYPISTDDADWREYRKAKGW